MKRIIALLLCISVFISLAACGTNEDSNNSSSGDETSSTVTSSGTASATVGGDGLEISDDGHFTANFEVWTEGTEGKSDYVKYMLWFSADGTAVVTTGYFKELKKDSATDSEKAAVNDSIAKKEAVWFCNSSGGTSFSWQENGVGEGAQLGGGAPLNFDELFTTLSDYWRSFVYGDVCVVPTAIFGENIDTFHSFSYTVDPETRVVTVDGEAPFETLILNYVGNVGTCTVNGTVARTEGIDYRFSEFMQNK